MGAIGRPGQAKRARFRGDALRPGEASGPAPGVLPVIRAYPDKPAFPGSSCSPRPAAV